VGPGPVARGAPGAHTSTIKTRRHKAPHSAAQQIDSQSTRTRIRTRQRIAQHARAHQTGAIRSTSTRDIIHNKWKPQATSQLQATRNNPQQKTEEEAQKTEEETQAQAPRTRGLGRFVNFFWRALSPPNTPQRLELSPVRMGWSWNRQNHPERPLWPRESISPRPRHRQPVEALPPSPEQRDKVAHRWVRVSNCHAVRAIVGNSMPRRPFPAGNWEPTGFFLIHQYRALLAATDHQYQVCTIRYHS
jgi:hypothetical protein